MSTGVKSAANPATTATSMDPITCGLYGCDLFHFSKTDGLYQRHLLFDSVKDPAATGPREHFEAAARSVRDILSQRWVATEKVYERENPKPFIIFRLNFSLVVPWLIILRTSCSVNL
jgi:starch phosphorylase